MRGLQHQSGEYELIAAWLFSSAWKLSSNTGGGYPPFSLSQEEQEEEEQEEEEKTLFPDHVDERRVQALI